MAELILTQGLPSSGKTTKALELVHGDPSKYLNVNRDDIRIMLFGPENYSKFTRAREDQVTRVQEHMVMDGLDNNKSVIISDTNLNPSVVDKWRDVAVENGAEFILMDEFLKVPYGVCMERNAARVARGERGVPNKVIMDMFNRYRDKWDGFDLVKTNWGLPSAYIFDIDGTLALMNGRRPYDWDKVGTDVINAPVVEIANMLYDAGNQIIILSGRDGSSYEMTDEWLAKHKIDYHQFYMREAGDNRKDWIIKRELFDDYVRPYYNVRGVFDDRDQVVHLWRAMGLPCFQVGYGPF